MAGRIRTIKPEVLDDEVLCGLSDTAWRLLMSMRVLADDFGNVRAAPRYLAAQTWQDTGRDATTPLEELVQRGKVLLYDAEGQSFAHLLGWDTEQRIDNRGKPRVPQPPAEALAEVRGGSRRLAEVRGDSPREEEKPSDSPRITETRGEPPRTSEDCGNSPPRACAPDLRPPTSDPDQEADEREKARAREGEHVRLTCDTEPLQRALYLVCKSAPHARLVHAVASVGENAAAADKAIDATLHAIKFVETYGTWRRGFQHLPAWSPEAISQHATSVQRVMSGEDPMPTPGGRAPPGTSKADMRKGRASVSNDWSEPS